jgi:hypothetical protein
MSKRLAILAFIGAGVVTAAVLLFPHYVVLEIAPTDTERHVLCAKMRAGDEFVLAFTHSVNRRPVYDTIRLARGHVVVVKSRYDAFGAGMPEHSTAEGTFRVAEDGWIEWTINRPMPELVVRVGRVANHTLHLKGREIPLASLAPPGTAVALRARTYSEFDLWKGRCLR